MNTKEKKLSLIFAMFFVAVLLVSLLFNSSNTTGEAIKKFNSIKKKNSYCELSCDKEMKKTNPEYSNWIDCHEKCMKN